MQLRGYQRASEARLRLTVHMETARRTRRVSWRVVAVVAAALAYSWVASGLRPFTHPEAVAVSIPLVVSGVALLLARAGDDGEGRRRGTWVWAALFIALVAWELVSYRLSPRVDHPTLSSIADWAMSTHPGRFGMFAAWLVVGYWLFRR
jgi:hypothetical protein